MLTFRLNLKKSLRWLHKSGMAARIVDPLVKAFVADAVLTLKNQLVLDTPVVTGITRLGWQLGPIQVFRGSVKARVFTTKVSAIVMERGAKPHFPPLNKRVLLSGPRKGSLREISEPALGVWIRRKFGTGDPRAVFAIARAISRKFAVTGIPAKRTFSRSAVKAFVRIRARKQRFIKAVVRALAADRFNRP